MRKCGLIALAVLWIFLLCMPVAGMAEAADNLLRNPSFEELDKDGMPVGWFTDAYRKQEGYTIFSVSEDAQDGAYCVTVNNLAENDARFAQTVAVEPETLYCLSGWIRAEDIPDNGHGANLSVEGVYAFSEGMYASGGWRYIEWYGETGEDQKEITVFARVGGYSGESSGKASFDNLCLEKVDSVPGDGVAALWFDAPREQVSIAPVDSGEEEESGPFWPWLLALSAAFLLAAAWARPTLMLDRRALGQEKRGAPAFLWVGLGVALAARLITAVMVDGYQVDVNCFLSWGSTMVKVGPTQFYQATNFCDYPPAYVYVLGVNSALSGWISRLTAGHAVLSQWLRPTVIFKLIPSVCDLAAAYLLYRMGREEKLSRNQAGVLALGMAFNPAFFINSAAWCQMDAVLCLGLMLVAWLAIRRKWAWVMPLYMLCVLVKPQALMLGFLGLTAIVMEWIRRKESRKGMVIGVGAALAVAAAVLIPFSIHQEWDWLITLYGKTLASYPHATVNTANYYYLFNANWVTIEAAANRLAPLCLGLMCLAWGAVTWLRRGAKPAAWLEPALMAAFALAFLVMACVGVTWAVVGTAAMAMAFAVVLPMYVRAGDLKCLPLLGGLLFLLLYVLGIKMHERYLFPALLFFLMAFALRRDWRILLLAAVTACTVFINEGIVLDNSIRLGSTLGHLNQDTKWLNMALSVVNVLCVPLAVWVSWRVCVEKAPQRLDETVRPVLPAPRLARSAGDPLAYRTDPSLHWKRVDWVLMLSVTLVYSVVALWNLGSLKAPQNPWKSTAYDEAVTIDLGEHYDGFRMLYFAQVSYDDFSIAVSEDGESWSDEHWAEMAQGQCFRWKYVANYTESTAKRVYSSNSPATFSGRYVRLTAQQVGLILDEVIFRDAEGNTIPASVIARTGESEESPLISDPAALLDEQDALSGEPSWYNSTYFDEIYHARTAFEHLNGTAPYETTHPPLGKVIMSWCVGIFGMTPFGWRFAGALAGILMLPAMYLLGKQLTKRTDMAFAAMALMALDCMHLTQTRIATIDSFPVLFILWSYLFMLRFMQRDMAMTPVKKLLPDLALSGLFMGLGIASKWIGIYAGAGLAVLFFWACARHIRMSCDAMARKDLNGLPQDARHVLACRAEQCLRRPLILCLWCLLFFVAVPAAIYLVSYVPYFAYAKLDGVRDFIARVIKAQENMFDYHSTPGLGMDHPFYSPWYEWPLIKRPMYYAMAQFMPTGYSCSIFCFGNPAVWLVGLAGIACTAAIWLWRRRYVLDGSDALMHWQSASASVAPAFVLIGLLAQFLPWVIVPRGTYIYHYFASVPFLCLGTTLMLHWLRERFPRVGRWVLAIYLTVCLVLFIGFYPYASGITTPTWWLDFMKQFLRIYYA